MLHIRALTRPGLGPVDLDIASGEILALTGPSGAGKSLLLRAIVDLDCNQGTVRTGLMDRAQVGAEVWRKSVAMLPAESGWWEDGVAAHFTAPDTIQKRLPELGLPIEAMGWQVATLSSGERHRLALLRLLENDPDVLLLDELTAALDPETTVKVESLLGGLAALGKTILLVTHDPDQPARLGARVARIEAGRMV